ncbi:SNARE-associated protein Snapin-like [Xenia sp. Carnegie-2017]|uniref:SNARE-associated protein Snapin-like n=1 Tax=Xenia sp. Carnegie-2017 TaxID=2897299 RepID=UPI001F0364F4|nr:SNARE-associated protein Snapin-like [Xenia sp. Carnegie-2017]
MADTELTSTSASSKDEKTSIPSFSAGLMLVLQPSIEALDEKVNVVRASQVELREKIDELGADLAQLNERQDLPVDLEPYVKKLIGSRRRITLVNNILHNAQERLKRLNSNIARQTAKKKSEIDASLHI